MMFSYTAYGLGIHSSLRLPELLASDGKADAMIRLGVVARLPRVADGTGAGFWSSNEEACHFVEGVGAFLVRGGHEITVDPSDGVDERVLRLSLLGPALALLLLQRGQFVLHASAVAVDGGAVAFLGGRGWGKSTAAAALYLRGHGIVTDDVTAVSLDASQPMVSPGFPQLKLWPDAVASLGEAVDTLPRVHPIVEKRALRVVRDFPREPLPLKRLYVLAEGPRSALEPIRPDLVLIELVRHWYGARFGDQLLRNDEAIATHFRQCAQLAGRVPVRRLVRRLDKTRLLSPPTELVEFVESDLAESSARGAARQYASL